MDNGKALLAHRRQGGKANRVKQADLATRMDVPFVTICNWENNVIGCTDEDLKRAKKIIDEIRAERAGKVSVEA